MKRDGGDCSCIDGLTLHPISHHHHHHHNPHTHTSPQPSALTSTPSILTPRESRIARGTFITLSTHTPTPASTPPRPPSFLTRLPHLLKKRKKKKRKKKRKKKERKSTTSITDFLLGSWQRLQNVFICEEQWANHTFCL